MTTYKPISCDCLINVEAKHYIKRCNIHKTTRDVKDCYSHNLRFTDTGNHTRARTEKERIRNL